jgi:hypothetical protein
LHASPPDSHYYPGAPVVNAPAWGTAAKFLTQLLNDPGVAQTYDWEELPELLQAEGVLRYAAHQLLTRGSELPDPVEERFRQELRWGEAEKLSDDLELARIFEAAADRKLPAVLIKGEALARTLYPAPACRSTGDYDLLIRPRDLPAFQDLMGGLGYRTRHFFGQHIFAEQDWYCPPEVRGRRYLVDLHWDITNRRFFRQRADLGKVLQDSVMLPLESGQCRIPSHAHSLLIACVHLGAAPIRDPVQLRWLLDIRLLLECMSKPEVEGLVREAQRWRLAGVVVVYCALAHAVLGPIRHTEYIAHLQRQVSHRRRNVYRWTCDRRWFDLLHYGARLRGVRQRLEFLREVLAYMPDWKARRKG